MRLWPRSEQRTLTPPEYEAAPFVYFPLTTDGAAVTPATALMNPTVWACTRLLADSASVCPLIPYRRDPEGGRRRIGGRIADLLERPSGEGSTQSSFIGTVMQSLLLHGNCFVGKFRGDTGTVEQLLVLDPTAVQVERRSGKLVYTVTLDGKTSRHGVDDILHVRALGGDSLTGWSPIRMMRSTIVLDESIRLASTSLFQNGARPSGILSIDSTGSAEQMRLLKEQWKATRTNDPSSIAVLSGDLSYTAIGLTPDDAQYIQARRLSATEICRAFRVPGWMVGAADDNSLTYSNVESQSLAFVVYSLQPWLVCVEQAFTADRDLCSSSVYVEFLVDGLLRGDSMSRSEFYQRALDPVSGWMTRNEVRRAENLELEPDGVEPMVPSLNGQEGAFA